MIDHYVLIGGVDVSRHVISVETNQTIENDANPGTATVALANVDMMYTDAFIPQLHEMNIFLYNFVYTETMTFRVFEGHVTDTVANPDTGEITITAEDDLGHLVDALPTKFNYPRITCKDAMFNVLKTHDTYIQWNWNVSTNPEIGPVVWDEQNNYQDVLLAIQERTGCLYYFNEKGVLVLYDATYSPPGLDLDKFVSNPCQAKSIMGFVNGIQLNCYRSEQDTEELQNVPASDILVGNYIDNSDYGQGEIKKLVCPLKYIYNIHNQEDADAAAKAVWDFYNTKRDAMTELILDGLVPSLQSQVEYYSFVPVDSGAVAVKLYGMVLERRVSYSANGLECTIKIHPRTTASEPSGSFPAHTVPPASEPLTDPEPEDPPESPYGPPIVDDDKWFIAPSNTNPGYYFVRSKTGDARVPGSGNIYSAALTATLYGGPLP